MSSNELHVKINYDDYSLFKNTISKAKCFRKPKQLRYFKQKKEQKKNQEIKERNNRKK